MSRNDDDPLGGRTPSPWAFDEKLLEEAQVPPFASPRFRQPEDVHIISELFRAVDAIVTVHRQHELTFVQPGPVYDLTNDPDLFDARCHARDPIGISLNNAFKRMGVRLGTRLTIKEMSQRTNEYMLSLTSGGTREGRIKFSTAMYLLETNWISIFCIDGEYNYNGAPNIGEQCSNCLFWVRKTEKDGRCRASSRTTGAVSTCVEWRPITRD